MAERVILELELVNGNKILRNFDPDKCYMFEEKTINKYSFCKSFPFIKKTQKTPDSEITKAKTIMDTYFKEKKGK